ncbi:MAG: sarcosine oxidase subunit gamma [Pseudomonadota bacterium]
MPDLVADTPSERGATKVDAASLSVLAYTPMHLLAPFPGGSEAMAAALTEAYGVRLPAPGESLSADGAELRWAGRDQALLLGPDAPAPALHTHGAVTDVSDVYLRLMLTGPSEAADILARLVPIDLRPLRFASGATAKTLLGHISAQVTARADGVEIMVMRSFWQSAFHEIETAMTRVAGRAALPPD